MKKALKWRLEGNLIYYSTGWKNDVEEFKLKALRSLLLSMVIIYVHVTACYPITNSCRNFPSLFQN